MPEGMIIVAEDPASAVREAMKEAGLNQTQLADSMKISRQSIQQSLNRKSKNMRVATMVKIVNAIGYDVVLAKR